MQRINQTVTQGAIKMYAPHETNPLSIRVPDDDESSSTACSSCSGTPNSPWPQLDQYTPTFCRPSPSPREDARAAFERASAAFDQAKPRWDMMSREEGWKKEAPSKFDYTGKRNKKGMPDKRTAAGKAWFQQQREEELKTALRKVLNRHSFQKK